MFRLLCLLLLVISAAGQTPSTDFKDERGVGMKYKEKSARQAKNYEKIFGDKHARFCRGMLHPDLAYNCITYHMHPECFNYHNFGKGIEIGEDNDYRTDYHT